MSSDKSNGVPDKLLVVHTDDPQPLREALNEAINE